MSKIIVTTEEELQRIIEDSLNKHFSTNSLPSDPHEPDRKYLSVAEAAAYLNLAKPTMYRFTSNREIPLIKRTKRLLFLRSDLDAWLLQGRKKSKAEIRADIAAK